MTTSHPREERGQAVEGFVPYDAEFAGDRLSRLKRAWSNHVMPDEADHVWLLRMATKGVDALAASQAAPVTGTEGERSWLPMKDAPTGVPIIAKHKPNARMPLGWVGTIALGHGDEEEPGALDTILHYNGDALIWNFHGCWEGWLPFGSAIPTPAPQPAGAERVDLGEMERLSAAAPKGTWHPDEYEAHDEDGGPSEICCDGIIVLDGRGDTDSIASCTRRVAEFACALVNAYRSGHLVPASLPAALGSGEGTAGATASSGRGWRQDCFRTRMEAFDRAYRKAGETSQPQDWMDAALLAQQFRNVAYAVLTDEAPKQEPPASTGWVLVPREPTDAMIQDGGSMLPPTHRLTDCYDYFREAWAAALDARPIPPSALAGEARRAETEGLGSRASDGEAGTPKSLATLTASQEQDSEVRS